MTDRKDVLRGLLCISGIEVLCNTCLYAGIDGLGRGYQCKHDCAIDAITLLRESEPSIMTMDEVQKSAGNPMWFESRGKYRGEKGWWCLSHGTDPSLHIRITPANAETPIVLSLTDYNKVWRCWNAPPTYEQMDEVKWDE